jgi:hypothetical protein
VSKVRTLASLKNLSLFILLSVSCSAVAESKLGLSSFDVYVGAGGSIIGVDAVDSFQKDVKFKAGEVLGGVAWRWIGVEARYGLSLMDESVSLGPDPDTQINQFAELGIDSYESIYLRLQLENKYGRVYALYGESEVTVSSLIETLDGPVTSLNTATGDSYGIGVGIPINDHLNFNVEAKNLIDNEDDTFTQVSIGVDFHFW